LTLVTGGPFIASMFCLLAAISAFDADITLLVGDAGSRAIRASLLMTPARISGDIGHSSLTARAIIRAS